MALSSKAEIKASKFLSLVLRHNPRKIGLTLDDQGWAEVDALLAGLKDNGRTLSREDLMQVVTNNSKKRFALSEDGKRIRASQGHSVDVELGYKASAPPSMLFHGTVDKFLDAIREQGLLKMKRHHVHLSTDRETAEKVGQRRGKPVILQVYAEMMVMDGHEFFVSANGVWLTESVLPRYLGGL